MNTAEKDERILTTLKWAVVMSVVIATLTALVGCSLPTATTDDATVYSPRGWFRFDSLSEVAPTALHGELAERRWQSVSDCFGLRYTPRGFKITLRSGPWVDGNRLVGGLYHPRMSIEVIATDVQSWLHELAHYLLDATTGNPDPKHERGGLVEYSPGHFQGADWLRCTVQ